MSNPERINIKDLTLEEPEKKKESGLSFDPERDITEEDWDRMKHEFDKIQEKIQGHIHTVPDLYGFSVLGYSMKILFTDRLPEGNINDFMGEIFAADLKYEPDTGMYSDEFLSFLMHMAILSPQKLRDEMAKYNMGKFTISSLEARLIDGRRNDWHKFSRYAIMVKIIFPKEETGVDFSQEDWRGMKDWLDQNQKMSDLRTVVKHLVAMKILFPDRFHEIDVEAIIWKSFDKRLTKERVVYMLPAFAELAAYLKLLAAEEIKITDQGLEVIMQKEKPEFKKETPPMPQTRKF